MRRLACAAILLSSHLALAQAADTPAPKVELLLADDFAQLTTKGWWAVCSEAGEYRLVAVPRARPDRDALGSAGCPRPLYFVRGLAGLSKRRLTAPFEVARPGRWSLLLNERTTVLREATAPGACFALEGGFEQRVQTLLSVPEGSAGCACVPRCFERLWGGDLDGDDRLDLLLVAKDAKGERLARLLLSAPARAPALFVEVATRRVTPNPDAR